MSVAPVVLVCFLAFTSFAGSRVLMTLFAIDLGATPFMIGVLIGLYAVFPLLLSVYVGRVVDQAGSFRPVLLGTLGFGLGLLVPAAFPVLPALYVSAALGGLSLVFFSVATQYLISSFGDRETRNRNVSLYSLGLALTGMSGPMTVGLVIDHLGHVAAFIVLAGIVGAGVVVWACCRARIPDRPGGTVPRQQGASFELLRQPALRRIIIVSGLTVASVDLFSFYMPIYGHSIGLSATMIGVVFGAFALATFAVRGLLPWMIRRFSGQRVMVMSLLVSALAYGALPFSDNLAMLLALAFLLGAGLGCGQPLSLIMVSNRAPDGRAGEAIGLRFTMVNFMHLAIPVGAGALSAALGLLPVFLGNAILLLAGSRMSRAIGRAVR